MLKTAGARVVGDEIPAPYADRLFTAGGRLGDESVRRRLADLVAALVRESRLRQRLVA